MPKKRNRDSKEKETAATISADIGMFKKPKPIRARKETAAVNPELQKTLKEERALIKMLKDDTRSELIADLEKDKKDLKEDYTEQDVENILELMIEELKKEGIIKKILDNYLKKKIVEESSSDNIKHTEVFHL